MPCFLRAKTSLLDETVVLHLAFSQTFDRKTHAYLQFTITSPHNGESWKMMDEMISNSEDFCKSVRGIGV